MIDIDSGFTLDAPPYLGLLSAFPKKRILVVGDLVADEYLYGETDRISREAPVLIVRYESSEVKLGGAGNAAANLKAMGAQVAMLGIVGNDPMGKAVRAESQRLGIELFTPKGDNLTTETKTRVLAGGRNTRRQQMIRIDKCQKPLSEDVVRSLVELIQREAAKSDAILVSDYGAGVLSQAVIEAISELAKSGKLVCVDSRYRLNSFAGPMVLKPNESEFEALAGFHCAQVNDDESFLTAAKKIRSQMGLKALLVTRGSSGMILTTENAQTAIHAYGTHATVDVTGAGDTVAAALALSLAAGGSFLQSAHLANVAGALKVRKMGTVTVSNAELRSEIEDPS